MEKLSDLKKIGGKVTKIGTKINSNETKLCPNSKYMKKTLSNLKIKVEKLSDFEKVRKLCRYFIMRIHDTSLVLRRGDLPLHCEFKSDSETVLSLSVPRRVCVTFLLLTRG